MKKILLLCTLLASVMTGVAQNDWAGKRVGVLGDSMTDPRNKSANYHYYDYLRDSLGIVPYIFARSGNQWHQIYTYAEKMIEERGDSLDAILIWAGTNDYMHSTPMGQFYTERDTIVNYNGKMVPRKARDFVMVDSTFCGRINRVMSLLKHRYPRQQIVIMTPPHRGLANLAERNVQPHENIANGQDLYIEDYVHALCRAGELWSVPVIDVFSLCGLYPMDDSYNQYINRPESDRLHPNNEGHIRIGKTILGQLRNLPSRF